MQIIKAIKDNPQESRRKELLRMMERAGSNNGNNTKYQLVPVIMQPWKVR